MQVTACAFGGLTGGKAEDHKGQEQRADHGRVSIAVRCRERAASDLMKIPDVFENGKSQDKAAHAAFCAIAA